jgi:hypothetical protein
VSMPQLDPSSTRDNHSQITAQGNLGETQKNKKNKTLKVIQAA